MLLPGPGDALGLEQHHQHEQQPEPQQPSLRHGAEDVAGQEVDRDSDHRSPEADEAAADEGHHDDHTRCVQAHDVGVRTLLRHREQRPGEPRNGRGQGEHRPLEQPDVVSDEARPHLVLPDRLQHLSERRMDEPPQEDDDDGEDEQDEVEEGGVRAQVRGRRPELQRGTRDVQQPVLPAGDGVPLDGDEPEHLAERDGHQREVDAAPVRQEAGHDRAGDEPRGDRAGDAEQEALEDVELEEAECVGADPEEGAVPEARKPRVAEQQVEAEAVDHPDRDLDAEVLVEPDRPDPERKRRKDDQQEHHLARDPAGGDGLACGHQLTPPARSSCRTGRACAPSPPR